MKQLSKKVVMLGDFSVGKTSLICRYVENAFRDEYLTTIGVKISRKSVVLEARETTVQLLIWDIEGQTGIKTIPSHYLVGASGGIVVADATRPDTVASVAGHVAHFRDVNPGSPVLVAVNKTDLVPDVQTLLTQPDTGWEGVVRTLMTSAKSGEQVEALFRALAEAVSAR